MAVDWDLQAVVAGYAQGYFLMADEETGRLSWYKSRRRTLIPLDERFRYPTSLRRVLNQRRFTPGINGDFMAVVEGCANRETTWISEDLKALYHRLYRAGWAFSFETWQGNDLAGGVLGLAIGGAFIGESMFFRISEGSKAALVYLVEHLRARQFQVFDAQLMNPHLARFGAFEVDDRTYTRLLTTAIALPCHFS